MKGAKQPEASLAVVPRGKEPRSDEQGPLEPDEDDEVEQSAVYKKLYARRKLRSEGCALLLLHLEKCLPTRT